MQFLYSHFEKILDSYVGRLPLAHVLREYGKRNPKLGSRDRKILSEMLYSWFRSSKCFTNTDDIKSRIHQCVFICGSAHSPAKRILPVAFQENITLPYHEKLSWLSHQGIAFEPHEILPHSARFSDGISRDAWISSMFQQPKLFLRIRKHESQLADMLIKHQVPFERITETCWALPNSTPVQKLLPADSYVVQDFSSQSTAHWFAPKPNEQWWDCCSGAGGKSLLLKDLEPSVILTVSDIRPSILHNLKERFRIYGHRVEQSFVSDLTQPLKSSFTDFNGIICDVPCSGSGTWGRTPEQLYFYQPESLSSFTERQKIIAGTASKHLHQTGKMLYITCSVWQEENEDVIRFLEAEHSLICEDSQIINGIPYGADSMFVAVLRLG